MLRSSPASAERVQLYRPNEHEALAGDAWDDGKVYDAVAAIVDEAEGACDGRFWPDHPRDEWPAFPPGPTTARIHENRANPTWELAWGSPGTMLAARACGFDELWREGAKLLWAAWDEETNLFTQDLHGQIAQYLGPAHGLAGNVNALREHVANAVLAERLDVALGATAQHHGTAGNGYAFLKLFALTGDELWRECARRFAMHAISQVERERSALGRGRYTLWTGDVGVALYLQSCLDDDARVPTVDFW